MKTIKRCIYDPAKILWWCIFSKIFKRFLELCTFLVFLYNTTLFFLFQKFRNMALYVFKCTKMLFWMKSPNYQTIHCVKSVNVRSYTGSYFPGCGLNTERYRVYLRMQSESGKIQTRKMLNTDIFHAVIFKVGSNECCKKLFKKQTTLIREIFPS